MDGQHHGSPPASPALAEQKPAIRFCPSCGNIESITLDEADTRPIVASLKAAIEEAYRIKDFPKLRPIPASEKNHEVGAEAVLTQISAVIQKHQAEGGISTRDAMSEIIAIVESAPMQINTGRAE
ncbi:hypothetical protein [Alcaligenes phenolicus]|uniref:hypothetical protein n=1 Tax=Alcaligenes phenolicus TaxID=232846 RepID=UPI002AA73EF3|nr:hypothetical protein [Alcaligenes phenolicus]